MFSTPGQNFPTGLTHVLFSAWAVKAVDTLLLPLVLFWRAFGGKDIAKFLATLENYIQSRLFCHPSQCAGNVRDIWQTHKGPFLNLTNFRFTEMVGFVLVLWFCVIGLSRDRSFPL